MPTLFVTHQAQGPGHAEMPPAPALMLGDAGDDHNNHWDNPG
jgi:hypothetical protein